MYKKIILALLLSPIYFTSHHLYAADQNIMPCKEIPFQDNATEYAGHYYLSNIMEVGSELLLETSGNFKWYLIVGSLDQYAEGTWWKSNNCIGFKVDKKYKKHLSIFPQQLQLKNGQLHVIWHNMQQEGIYIKARYKNE